MTRAAEGASRASAPFVIVIALSAFLLFCLEFLAARLVLPVFGGSPAVWTTTLSFFTAVLFLGYVYAHFIATHFSPKSGGLIQVALAIAVIVLTIAAPTSIATLKEPGLPAALNVLLALAVLAGPAAFLLASTTPLFSAWFAHGRGSPWWLYAVSNGASFAALIAYPVVIAPSLSLSLQRSVLAIALAGYVVVLTWKLVRWHGRDASTIASAGTTVRESPGWQRQILWILAAAVPAGLMSATTVFITTDLVSAPLIWIGPLGVYLLSYVVAFSERGRSALRLAEWLVPAAATLMWLPIVQSDWPVFLLLGIENISLLVVSVAIHGRLALDRPTEGQLTRFYMLISLGGLIATAFVALLAPILFPLIYEYPLLIVTAVIVMVLLPTPLIQYSRNLLREPFGAALDLTRRLAPYAIAAAALFTAFPADAVANGWLLLVGGIVVAVSLTPRVCAIVTVAAVEFFIITTTSAPLLRERTFFGITEVFEVGSVHSLYSGTTLHGVQFTDGRAGEPASYYVKSGPLGAIFEDLRSRREGLAIGVVGLGVGTIAAYAQADDQLTFFELDDAIIDIAGDPRYFSFLANAAVKPRIVSGDGRLSLEREPDASFDILVLDAFNSDVVPAHLLTREAMMTYRRVLRSGGVLALHLSSRYYDLPVAVGTTAQSAGLASVGKVMYFDESGSREAGSASSFWMVAGDAEDVARFMSRDWVPVPTTGPVLSDDHSDLTRLLSFGPRAQHAGMVVGRISPEKPQ